MMFTTDREKVLLQKKLIPSIMLWCYISKQRMLKSTVNQKTARFSKKENMLSTEDGPDPKTKQNKTKNKTKQNKKNSIYKLPFWYDKSNIKYNNQEAWNTHISQIADTGN